MNLVMCKYQAANPKCLLVVLSIGGQPVCGACVVWLRGKGLAIGAAFVRINGEKRRNDYAVESIGAFV